MNATFDDTRKLRRTTPVRIVLRVLAEHWHALQARRQRARVRAALFGLSNHELQDIGISRGEIDYLASNAAIDLRGASAHVPGRVLTPAER
jgi:uncharacterized protein YjiS (DUF1127 family)